MTQQQKKWPLIKLKQFVNFATSKVLIQRIKGGMILKK